MAAPYGTPQRKVEDAIAAVLATYMDSSDLDGATITKGRSVSAVAVPAIHVIADSAQPDPEHVGYATPTGNWMVMARVRVVSHGEDETRGDHDMRTAHVVDALNTDGLVADMTTAAITDLTVYRAWISDVSDEIDEGLLITEVQLQVYCSNLSPA